MKNARSNGGASTRTKQARLAAPVPAEFDGDTMLWAAWLYYEEDLTQDAISRELGISRASVNNLLQNARECGIVEISLKSACLESVGQARAIRDKFGVASCVVVPDEEVGSDSFARLGRAGARLLSDRLQPNDVLGVSWGRTVLAVSEALRPRVLPGLSVVQITGSAIGTYRFSAELCASNIAHRMRARCINMHAPGIVSKREVKDLLMQEPTLIRQFSIMSTCNHIIFGVGSVEASSTAFGSGFITEAEGRPYIQRGAVAVLAGRFLDRSGKTVLGELDDRMIGLTTDEIRAIPERICVAGAPDKVEPIRALLSGQFITSLVTNRSTAKGLLEDSTLN